MNTTSEIALLWDDACSHRALQCAVWLSRVKHATLIFVSVVTELRPEGRTAFAEPGREALIRERELLLMRAAQPIRESGVRVTLRVSAGEPLHEIANCVARDRCDVLIVPSESAGGVQTDSAGSTFLQLVQLCHCPVILHRPGNKERFRRILAVIDPATGQGPDDSFDRNVLDVASSLATQAAGELHVVHTWELLFEAVLSGRRGIGRDGVQELIHEHSGSRRAAIEQWLERHHVTPSQLHVLKGTPADLIPRLVADLDIDLLVIERSSRTIAGRFVFGDTTEQLLNAVNCSVMVVQPKEPRRSSPTSVDE